MKIKASCGNAPHSIGLNDRVYKLTLTATTIGEQQWLAGLLKALDKPLVAVVLREKPPTLEIRSKC